MKYEDLEGNLLMRIEAELKKRGISNHKPEEIQLKKSDYKIEVNYKGILKITLITPTKPLRSIYHPSKG